MRAHRHRLTSAAGAAAIGVLLAAGCSPAQKPEAAAKAPAPKPLTTAQFAQAALKESEVPRVAGPVPVQEPDSGGRTLPPVSDPACQPLIDIVDGKSSHAHVFQIFNWRDNIMGGSSTLASFEEGEAEERFAEVKKAVTTCRAYEGESHMGPIRTTVRPERAPKAGDETAAFRSITPLGPKAGDNNKHTVVVRTGNTIATFSELSMGTDRHFPTALITLQADHLRDAQRP